MEGTKLPLLTYLLTLTHQSSNQLSVAVLSRLLAQRPGSWNALPEDVTSSQSEYTFRRQLKTWLFKKSFRTSSSDTDYILTLYDISVYISTNFHSLA